MAEDNKYDQESIRELLSWAQDTLNNKTYPEGGLVLDKCIKVIDCKSHIEAMIQMIGKNWENPTFYPTRECNLNSVWFLFLLNHNKYNFFFLDLQMLLKVVFGCVQGRRRMSRLYTLAHIRELPFLCV